MTKTLAKRTVQASAIAAGFLLLAGGAAQAAGPDAISAGNQGVADGNQVIAPVQAPIDVCGNGVSALVGVTGAGCTGGSDAKMSGGNGGDMSSMSATESSHVTEASGGDMGTVGNNGIGNGNQVQAPIQAPINVCGNAVAVAGVSGAGCDGGSSAKNTEAGGDMLSAGNQGIGNGNQVQAPIQVPINVCGNSIAVLGVAGAGCDGGSDAKMGAHSQEAAQTEAGVPGVADVASTGGGVGETVSQTASQLPAGDTVSGLAGGLPTSGLTGSSDQQAQQDVPQAPATEKATEATGGDMLSAGNNGILNGTQVQTPIQVPVDVSGNAVGVLGVAGAGSTGGSSANMAG